MGEVLYRKYRSKKLSEIVGQDHITKTLQQALTSGRISHAYLFTGPRGVGKTSIARILAHEVNDLDYASDHPHIDIIEIDAASNRRIDEIRDLRDKVYILPSSAKYKVYIIDEVHMLTKEAFNALLKTLEEPPAHVIFILATTDAHKLPDTIISRTQRFTFKPVEKSEVIRHLKMIAKKEKINVTDEALDIIAEHGEGSFRDSISLLDQLSSAADKITADDVLTMLGIPSDQALDQIIKELESKNSNIGKLNDLLNNLYDQGYSPAVIAKVLMNQLRTKLVSNKLSINQDQAIELLKQLLEVEGSSDPASYLQLTLFSQLPISQDNHSELQNQPPEINQSVEVTAANTAKKQPLKTADESTWPNVLSVLKERYNTLYGIVRMAEPVFKDNQELDLIFNFAFHQKRVNDLKNKQIIADIILNLTGQDYKIECLLNPNKQSAKSNTAVNQKPSTEDLDNIHKIFGGGEVID